MRIAFGSCLCSRDVCDCWQGCVIMGHRWPKLEPGCVHSAHVGQCSQLSTSQCPLCLCRNRSEL